MLLSLLSILGLSLIIVKKCFRVIHITDYRTPPKHHLDSLTDSLTDSVNYPFLTCTSSCIYRSSRATFTIKSLMQFLTLQSLQDLRSWSSKSSKSNLIRKYIVLIRKVRGFITCDKIRTFMLCARLCSLTRSLTPLLHLPLPTYLYLPLSFFSNSIYFCLFLLF